MDFAPLTATTAPERSRPLAAASEKQFGFLPEPVARAARSPALLQHLLAGFGAFDRSSLAPLEREVVALTIAFENECHYCVALHSALLTQSSADPRLIAALRDGVALDDGRLEALRRFARSVYLDRGRVAPETLAAFERAGFDAQNALDVILGVGVYVLSTLVNVVSAAPLDPAFAAFAWTKPGSATAE